jgi:putative membrane protein
MKIGIVVAALALGVAASPALAQAPSKTVKHASTKQIAADHAFMMAAARGDMAEVDLGKLAVQKASSEDVKKFGQRMVDDHSKANDKLEAIAREQHVTLPDTLSAQDKALQARLDKLSGEAFDRAYMSAMVRNHREDVKAFMHEEKVGANPAVKTFASDTLPMLQAHLKLARSTDRQVVATTGRHAGKRTGTVGTTATTPRKK